MINFGKYLMEYTGDYRIDEINCIECDRIRPSDEIRNSILKQIEKEVKL